MIKRYISANVVEDFYLDNEFKLVSDEVIEENRVEIVNGVEYTMYDKTESFKDGVLVYEYSFVPKFKKDLIDIPVEGYTRTGNPREILSDILRGTIYTGTAPDSPSFLFSSGGETKTAILMDLVSVLEMGINISDNRITIFKPNEVVVCNKYFSFKKNIMSGNISFSLDTDIELPFAPGMRVKIPSEVEPQNVISISYNPFARFKVVAVTLNKKYPTIESDTYRSDMDMVKQSKYYYGTRVSYEKGIEIKRSDGISEAVFNSDKFEMSSMVDGVMTPAIYFDALERRYRLTGEVLIDGTLVSETIIVNNLYAQDGNIANLTVNRLITDFDRAFKYLDNNTSPINYIIIDGEEQRYITAMTDGTKSIQHTHFDTGGKLYWNKNPKDTARKDLTMSEKITEFPVMVYEYQEATAFQFNFEEITLPEGKAMLPVMTWGRGTDASGVNGRAKTYKYAGGFMLSYFTESGQPVTLDFRDDGKIYYNQNQLGSGGELLNLSFAGNSFSAGYEGVTVRYDFKKDAQGRIIEMINKDSGTVVPISWA